MSESLGEDLKPSNQATRFFVLLSKIKPFEFKSRRQFPTKKGESTV